MRTYRLLGKDDSGLEFVVGGRVGVVCWKGEEDFACGDGKALRSGCS